MNKHVNKVRKATGSAEAITASRRLGSKPKLRRRAKDQESKAESRDEDLSLNKLHH